MGAIFTTPSQPKSSSSPSATASPKMSYSDSPKPHSPIPTQLPRNQESEIPILDPPLDTKTAGFLENQLETETLSRKDTEESKPSVQVTLSEEGMEDSIKDGKGDEEVEEEEGECGFCLFMKGGGCKDTFTEWEKCVDEGEKNQEDIAEKCFQATAALRKCMEVHSDYYAPLLQAEKDAEEEAAKQLEEDKQRLNRGEELGNKEKEQTLGGSDKMK